MKEWREEREEEGEEDRDKYREQWKREKGEEKEKRKDGKEKKHVNPSAMLKGQVWTAWQQLSAGRLLCGSRESGLRT